MPFGQRHEILGSRAERTCDAFYFLEVEAGYAEIRIELRDDPGAAAGHEEDLALVVLEPRLDLLHPLDRVRGWVVEVGELEHSLKAPASTMDVAKRLLDGSPEVGGMLGKTTELLQDSQALGPELLLEQGVSEQAHQRIGLGALLGLAEGFCGTDQGVDVGGIALELVHPERFQLIEFLLFNQRACIFSEAQRH